LSRGCDSPNRLEEVDVQSREKVRADKVLQCCGHHGLIRSLQAYVLQGSFLRAQNRPGRKHDGAGFCCRLANSPDQRADPSGKMRPDIDATLLKRYGGVL